MFSDREISKYRQAIRQLIKRIDRISSRCLFKDPLIHGTPAEVFRKCGRATCKCNTSEQARHGPYKVIQIIEKGKQRQLCLRKDQEELWVMAKHYRHQIKKLSELKEVCSELQSIVAEVIKKRTQEIPTNE